MPGEIRKTYTVTTTADTEDFNADGGSVLVELTGVSSWDGTVDFQTTPDGETFFNVQYIDRTSLAPALSVSQISSPSTATLYLLVGPLSQVRINVGAGTVGTLTVVYRTVHGPIASVLAGMPGPKNRGVRWQHGPTSQYLDTELQTWARDGMRLSLGQQIGTVVEGSMCDAAYV